MALEKKIEMVADLVEAAKDFFVNLLRPDMTLEKISEIVSPRLDETIRKYEDRGLKYSAGKFSIKYADEKHFQLEFEMYFHAPMKAIFAMPLFWKRARGRRLRL